MSDPSRLRISGALEPFAPGFATELARQGYVPRAVVHHLHLVAHLSRWLTEQGLPESDLAAHTERFLTARGDHATGPDLCVAHGPSPSSRPPADHRESVAQVHPYRVSCAAITATVGSSR